MSKAMQSIVDTYVALNRPEALQELQTHRLKLIGSERGGFDLFRQQIEDELIIIRAGLNKLTAPPQLKPDEAKLASAVVTAVQQVAAEPELPLAIVPPPPPTLDERLPAPVIVTVVTGVGPSGRTGSGYWIAICRVCCFSNWTGLI